MKSLWVGVLLASCLFAKAQVSGNPFGGTSSRSSGRPMTNGSTWTNITIYTLTAPSGLRLSSGKTYVNTIIYEALYDSASADANSSVDGIASITGVAAGDYVTIVMGSIPSAGCFWAGYAGTDQVTIRFYNTTTIAVDPPLQNIKIKIDKFQ